MLPLMVLDPPTVVSAAVWPTLLMLIGFEIPSKLVPASSDSVVTAAVGLSVIAPVPNVGDEVLATKNLPELMAMVVVLVLSSTGVAEKLTVPVPFWTIAPALAVI